MGKRLCTFYSSTEYYFVFSERRGREPLTYHSEIHTSAVISRSQRVNTTEAWGFLASDYMQNYVEWLLLPLLSQVTSYFAVLMTVAVSTQADSVGQQEQNCRETPGADDSILTRHTFWAILLQILCSVQLTEWSLVVGCTRDSWNRSLSWSLAAFQSRSEASLPVASLYCASVHPATGRGTHRGDSYQVTVIKHSVQEGICWAPNTNRYSIDRSR